MRFNKAAVPTVEVEFEFPTPYEDDGISGDQLWKEMMPSKSYSTVTILHICPLTVLGYSWSWICPRAKSKAIRHARKQAYF